MKKCLVLEGGGMRGVYTAGVLDYFNEKGLIFDGCIGVSAGALNATRYLSNQPKKSINTTLNNLNNKEYCSIKSLIKTGNLFGTELLYNKIPKTIDPLDNNYFKKSKVKFRVVITDCSSGEACYPVIKDFFNDMDYIKASSSLPLLSKMVNINGIDYFDGGISDSIPIKKAINLGYDRNVVILTQPKDYIKKPSKITILIKNKYKKYKGLIKDIENRHNMYNDTIKYINEQEKQKSIFVIRPKRSLNIGRTEKNKEKLENGYKMGYEDAKEIYNDLIIYLTKK